MLLIRTSRPIPDIRGARRGGVNLRPDAGSPSAARRRPARRRRGAPDRVRPREAWTLRHPDFDRLYAAHAGRLLAFLVYRTGDRALAEDLLGDTFERALRARRRFDPQRGTEAAWLYAIALNCLRDDARRRSARTRALERTGGRADDGPAREEAVLDRDLVDRAMTVLSDDERAAIALRFGADLTMPEIAKATGERLTTVEGRIYRALGKLRAELAD
jgi:RNA polymerase sigma-70 factor (ECF subfamily)